MLEQKLKQVSGTILLVAHLGENLIGTKYYRDYIVRDKFSTNFPTFLDESVSSYIVFKS